MDSIRDIIMSPTANSESDSEYQFVPEDSCPDEPVSQEPNDVYKNFSEGYTLVFDSKTVFKTPKSRVTTPTSPTRHQRTFSLSSNTVFNDSVDSPNSNESSQMTDKWESKYCQSKYLLSDKYIREPIVEIADTISKKSIETTGSEITKKLNEFKEEEQIFEKSSSKNGNMINGGMKSTSITENPTRKQIGLKAVMIFLYFHITAAAGVYLILSNQVLWSTIAFTLGLHLLSAVGISMRRVQPLITETLNLHVVLGTLTNYVIPTVIPCVLWNENILSAFLVVAQIGSCLHWYGTWFVESAGNTGKN